MFCPECGIQSKSGAKFCFNCGYSFLDIGEKSHFLEDEVSEAVPIKVSSYQKKMWDKYTESIVHKLLNAYIDDEEIDAAYFYSKAKYYEMTKQQIDEIFSQFDNKIKKINEYIRQIYEEGKTIELSSDEIEEIIDFGESLEFDKESVKEIIEKYNENNEINEKRAYLNYLLKNYIYKGIIRNETTECNQEKCLDQDKEFSENIIEDLNLLEKESKDDVITIEESKTMQTEFNLAEGMQFDRGYISEDMVTDTEKMEAILIDPYILITDKKISDIQEILPLLEQIVKIGASLLIIAEDFEEEVITTLNVNNLRNVFNVVAVNAPGYGDKRKAMLEDIAILTDGQGIFKDVSLELRATTMGQLGRARYVKVQKENTIIVNRRKEYKEILEIFEKDIIEIEDAIGRCYKEAKNYVLKDAQIEKLTLLVKGKCYPEKMINDIVKRYDIKYGIETIRKELNENTILCAIEKEYGLKKKYKIWDSIFGLDVKFFFEKQIEKDILSIKKKMTKRFNALNESGKKRLKAVAQILSDVNEDTIITINNISYRTNVKFPKEIDKKLNKYVENKLKELKIARDKLKEINEQEELEKKYREERKDARGRWQGGGFGVSGAIKGAMTAGAMNAISGAAHSMFNAVGNLNSGISANNARIEVVNYFNDIPQQLGNILIKLNEDILKIMKEVCPQAFFDVNKTLDFEQEWEQEFEKADISLQKEIAVKLLQLNPYNSKNYLRILEIDSIMSEDDYTSLRLIINLFNVHVKLSPSNIKSVEALKEYTMVKEKLKKVEVGRIANEDEKLCRIALRILKLCETEKRVQDYFDNIKQIQEFDGLFPEKEIIKKYQDRINENIQEVRRKIDDKDMPMEDEIKFRKIDRTIASESQKKEIDTILNEFSILEKTIYDIETNYQTDMMTKSVLTFSKEGIKCEDKKKVRKIQEELKKIFVIYENCDVTNYESVKDAFDKAREISQITGCGLRVLKELEVRMGKLELERRTVEGEVFASFEEAEEVREIKARTIGSKVYDTIEEAQKVRAQKEEIVRSITELFLSKNEEKAIDKLYELFSNKTSVYKEIYECTLKELVEVKSESGVTLLMAALNYRNVISEPFLKDLINYGSDVNASYYSQGELILTLDVCAFRLVSLYDFTEMWNIYNYLMENGAKRKYDLFLQRKYKPFSEYRSFGEFINYVCDNSLTGYRNDLVYFEFAEDLCLSGSGKYLKAKKYFGIPDKEKIYVIVDTTIFGSCKEGFAICQSGIYYARKSSGKILWNEIVKMNAKALFDFFNTYSFTRIIDVLHYICVTLRNEIDDNKYLEKNIEGFEQQIKETKGMYCTYCGKKILRDIKFCNFCGAKVTYHK